MRAGITILDMGKVGKVEAQYHEKLKKITKKKQKN